MNAPIIDLEELLDEAKERIEEKLIIEGGFQAAPFTSVNSF